MNRTVAVIVPQYREEILPDEKISLRHLEHHLPDLPRIVIHPQKLKKTLPGHDTIPFPDSYFTGADAYSKLLLSPFFYEAFLNYEYILIYQLDCLVFSGDLQRWCDTGFDYIGAPLFDKNSPRPKFSRVGNGGLSLRRVRSFLDILRPPHSNGKAASVFSRFFSADIPDLAEYPIPLRWRKKAQVLQQAGRGVEWYAQNYSLNEDLFWSDRAKLFDPGFKIAPIPTGLQFAFERHPDYCFEQNSRRLPFGCHAWAKWDRAFWEPHLLC